MKRKLLYIVPVVLAFAAAIPLACLPVGRALGASSYDSSQRVSVGVINTIGGVSYDFPSSSTFSAGKNFGQDLYKRTYARVKGQGSDMAVARTLARRKLSKEELAILVPGTSIYDVLTKQPGEKLAPDVPTIRRNEIVADLAEEKELADLEVQATMDVAPSEIFANGDESDSGFDLISDLDLIQTILFGKADTAFGSGAPGLPGGGVNGDVNGGNPGEEQNNPGGGNNGPGGAGNAQGQQGPDGGAGKIPAGDAAGDGKDKASAPVICPVDDAFNSAVNSARDQEKKNAGGDGGAGDDKAGNNNGGGGDGKKPGDYKNSLGGDNNLISTPTDQTQIPAAAPGDWSKPSLCNSVFCLKFEAVYKKASSYQSSDNCIACHFEKINEAFKKTLDKNVAPNKQTGNIGEGPKCKRSMLNLKWNLVLIPQPILTPPNDDLVVKGDFYKNLKDFYEKYYKNPGRCQGQVGGACKPNDAIYSIPQKEIENAPPGTDIGEITQKIRDRITQAQQEAANVLESEPLEKAAISQAQQYQVILQEMDTMNTYFKAYITIFNAIGPVGKNGPCQILADKPQCS